MTEIKSIVFYSRGKLKAALNDAGFEFTGADFPPYFIDFFHNILPLKMKFLDETFVALDRGSIRSLITVQKDERSAKKLKITKLFIEKNSLDAGKMLVEYLISRYCAQGAQSFQVTVEEKRDDILSLFVRGCGFRDNAKEFIYAIKNGDIKEPDEIFENEFKLFRQNNAKDACKLYNSNINSYQKYNFSRTTEQFSGNFIQGEGQNTSFVYTLEDVNKRIYALYRVKTKNNKDYVLDFVVDRGCENHFKDGLSYVAKSLSKRSKNWTMYVKVKSFFANYESFKNILGEMQFPLVKSSKILTKDFLKPSVENNLLNSAKIIFNDITPAFKVKDAN